MCEKSCRQADKAGLDPAFVEIQRRLRGAKVILAVTHARADGDTIGASAALAEAARQIGKTATVFVPDDMPARFAFLLGSNGPAAADEFAALADEADLVVVVDTCAFAQLDGLEGDIRSRREKIVVIDHHHTVEDVGAVEWIDTSAAAVGVMVLELIEALDWPIGPAQAEALMTAITTDTGWLRFANTDRRALEAAGRLVGMGVRPDRLYKKLYQRDRPERIQLMARVLGGLELHCDGRLAAMTVRQSDFVQSGATSEETESLVNEALRIGGVDTAVLLVANSDCVRVSLRSRDAINVAAVAERFGGGGHPRAAGVRVDQDIDALKQRIITACARELTGTPTTPHP